MIDTRSILITSSLIPWLRGNVAKLRRMILGGLYGELVDAVYDAEGVEVAACTECLIPAGGPVPVVVHDASLTIVEIL